MIVFEVIVGSLAGMLIWAALFWDRPAGIRPPRPKPPPSVPPTARDIEEAMDRTRATWLAMRPLPSSQSFGLGQVPAGCSWTQAPALSPPEMIPLYDLGHAGPVAYVPGEIPPCPHGHREPVTLLIWPHEHVADICTDCGARLAPDPRVAVKPSATHRWQRCGCRACRRYRELTA